MADTGVRFVVCLRAVTTRRRVWHRSVLVRFVVCRPAGMAVTTRRDNVWGWVLVRLVVSASIIEVRRVTAPVRGVWPRLVCDGDLFVS